MKMNYLLDKKTVFTSSKNKKNGPNFFLVILLITILFVFGAFLFPALSQPVIVLANPLLASNVQATRWLKNVFNFFESKKALLQQNQNLQQELRLAKGNLFLAQAQLERLSSLVNLPISRLEDGQYWLGEVIARPRFLPYDILLLSVVEQSETNQPTIGSRVTWQGNILLGEIVQLSGTTAKAKLYSSPNVKHRVFVGEEKIQGVLEGHGGGNFTITLPRGLDIKKNDKVFLPADPRFILGLVGEVVKSPENPSQIIYVKTPVNIYTLDWVEINAL